MRSITLHIEENGRRLAPVSLAERGWDRTRGLLGRPAPAPGAGLLLTRCRAIHTIGMRYPIDVVFIDQNGLVHAVHAGVKPLRMLFCRRARHAVELACGQAQRLGIRPGGRLALPALHSLEG